MYQVGFFIALYMHYNLIFNFKCQCTYQLKDVCYFLVNRLRVVLHSWRVWERLYDESDGWDSYLYGYVIKIDFRNF